ncbi:MAG: DUF1810 domain-containing protein [Acidobacteria bacterium]|nr:DUF1810 domain-containing protein [Acidobacteriota bacterium]
MEDDDPFNLQRFVAAQHGSYEKALGEVKNGRKITHWMWYIFPQIAGLGESDMARKYAIGSLDEAREYLTHWVLGPRLREISAACLAHRDKTGNEIFGSIDTMKLRSSMTLFAQVAEPGSVFEQVLDAFFDGAPDEITLALLAASSAGS